MGQLPNASAVVSCYVPLAFFVLCIIFVLLHGQAGLLPYWFIHFCIAAQLFFIGAFVHWVVVTKFALTDGTWLAGYGTSIGFYLSREIRDKEKLGYWDLPGLLAPTIGVTILWGLMELSTYLVEKNRSKQTVAGVVPNARGAT